MVYRASVRIIWCARIHLISWSNTVYTGREETERTKKGKQQNFCKTQDSEEIRVTTELLFVAKHLPWSRMTPHKTV